MAKCPLCSQRSAKRYCPAKATKICPTCCGTKREIEIECPSECAYLRAGRKYEVRDGLAIAERPHREFSQQFRHRYAPVITALAQAILEERAGNASLLDKDVRDAFEALKATTRTLSAGIYYETLPDGGPSAMGLFRRVQTLIDRLIDRMMEPQGPGPTPLRASDVPDVLDFIVVSVDLHSGNRPKSRRYLDWLSSVAPPPTREDPGREDPGRLIVP